MTTAQDGGKVVSLTHQPPLPPGNTPDTHFCQRMSRPQGHSVTGRIMSLKNSNDTIGNRTRDLPVNNGCVVYAIDFSTQVTINQYIPAGTKEHSKKPQAGQFKYTWQALKPTDLGFYKDRS